MTLPNEYMSARWLDNCDLDSFSLQPPNSSGAAHRMFPGNETPGRVVSDTCSTSVESPKSERHARPLPVTKTFA